jgi:hypothetical protein
MIVYAEPVMATPDYSSPEQVPNMSSRKGI